MGLLLFVGGVTGFSVGVFLGALTLLAAAFPSASLGVLGQVLAPVIALASSLLGPLSIGSGLMVYGLTILIATAMAYALAAVSLVPLGSTPGAFPPVALELGMRGFMIGLTSSVNFLIWATVLGNPGIGSILALIGFLAAVPGVSNNRPIYQRILGFASWLQPTTYLVMPLGILLFIANLPSALSTPFGIAALRFDFLTATIETDGGAVVAFLIGSGPAPATPAFNLGNFTFLNMPPGSPAIAPFGTGGVSDHETGHTLTVAALGGFFYWFNALDENIPPLARGLLAYGELIPESHFGELAMSVRPFVAMW